MPNGVQPYATVYIPTVIPVTSVNTIPPSTYSSGPTSTGTVTAGPSGTPGGVLDTIASYATGIAGLSNGTGPGSGLSGTPGAGGGFGLLGSDGSTLIDVANSGNEIGSRIGDFFSILRNIGGFFLGKLGTILAFALLIVGFVLTLEMALFIIPIVISLFRLLLQLIQALVPW